MEQDEKRFDYAFWIKQAEDGIRRCGELLEEIRSFMAEIKKEREKEGNDLVESPRRAIKTRPDR
ncbi:MAG: hypothetical protein JRN22_02250 [Nitrososphaerota archaeon]|nr:hypothetical protein [Nitrososphaerota archaeon]